MKSNPANRKEPFLSVIIPVYNCERYVKRAAESVLSQPCAEELELILVDDGSTDRSGSICDEIAAAHSNVICVHKQNEKLPAARNSGIEAACGAYLAFLDADDWWQNNVFTEELIEAIRKSEADLVRFRFRQVSVSIRYEHTFFFSEGLFSFEPPEAKKEAVVSFCANYFFKRRLCIDNGLRFPKTPMHEDGVFLNLFLCYTRSLLSLPVLLMNYWMNPSSMVHSADPFYKYECNFIALRREEELLKERGFSADNNQACYSLLLDLLPKICAANSYRAVKEKLKSDSCALLRQEEILPWTSRRGVLSQWKRHPFLFWLKSRINPGLPLRLKTLLVRGRRTAAVSDYLQYRLKEKWKVIDPCE